ncbi:hypothetical protein SLS53_001246 [Cytospora paraplurivora]|uniref:Xylanolytic transcriptional activator regulatory domain-containing protein n=1 Tax=Cytospora paraplurivora TaxID=2898453 RepID=A0AAN9YMH5_9PEZI
MGAPSVGERIQQLETLVRSLVEQQQQQQTRQMDATLPGNPASSSPQSYLEGTTDTSAQGVYARSRRTTAKFPAEAEMEQTTSAASPFTRVSSLSAEHCAMSSSPPEHGSLRMHSHGANYVNSVHWAAVLNSISELKDQYEKEEEARMLTYGDCLSLHGPGPRLLYEPVQANKADILASIPARPVVDRMVAQFLNAQGVAPADPEIKTRVHMFRERTVQCLVLAKFTRGGAHVLETMIIHCASEVLMCKDAEIDLWLLLGILVQLALSLGYHRDSQNFPEVSPFTGEMRRRVWAAIVQMELRLSSQMGLPRLLKSQQCDTAEPRNMLDSDFDEGIAELPASRPETEVTPMLYGLAKNRIDSISGLISDLVADIRMHPYSEIMELDRKLQEAEASLPPIFRWQPLSQSLIVPPQVILHRVWFQLAVQRLVIWLHRKYLAPSHPPSLYQYSRDACVQAAIKILEFQYLVDEETQPHGLLHPVRWMLSSLMQSIFLLGMSVLCYYVQLGKSRPDLLSDRDQSAMIHELLRKTYPIWLRSSIASRDARKAVEHLSLLLGLRSEQEDASPVQDSATHLHLSQDAASSLDQVAWEAYQECIADFSGVFSANSMAVGSSASISMTDPLLAATAELNDWTTVGDLLWLNIHLES